MKVPTNVDLGDGGTTIRITDFYPPFVSSYNLLPCMVEMLTTAFDGVSPQAGNSGTHPNYEHQQFVCQQNGLELKLVGKQNTPPLEYSDLVRLARLVLLFQQRYRMPGIGFDYLDGGRSRGQGNARMMFAGNETTSDVVEA